MCLGGQGHNPGDWEAFRRKIGPPNCSAELLGFLRRIGVVVERGVENSIEGKIIELTWAHSETCACTCRAANTLSSSTVQPRHKVPVGQDTSRAHHRKRLEKYHQKKKWEQKAHKKRPQEQEHEDVAQTGPTAVPQEENVSRREPGTPAEEGWQEGQAQQGQQGSVIDDKSDDTGSGEVRHGSSSIFVLAQMFTMRGRLKRSVRAVQLFGRLAIVETHTLWYFGHHCCLVVGFDALGIWHFLDVHPVSPISTFLHTFFAHFPRIYASSLFLG